MSKLFSYLQRLENNIKSHLASEGQDKFPIIALRALQELPPSEFIITNDILEWILSTQEMPIQLGSYEPIWRATNYAFK